MATAPRSPKTKPMRPRKPSAAPPSAGPVIEGELIPPGAPINPLPEPTFDPNLTQAEVPQAPPAQPELEPKPCIFVAYQYYRKDGGSGFDQKVVDMQGLFDIRTLAHLIHVTSAIVKSDPNLDRVTIINWKPMEG